MTSTRIALLTYSTLLAIVPILAILFAVARGFGFDNLMEHQFRNGFGGATETSDTILEFVNSYLSQTKGGVFIGVGLIMLLWTVEISIILKNYATMVGFIIVLEEFNNNFLEISE